MEEETEKINEIKDKNKNFMYYVYHCKECGEIPLLDLSLYYFNIYCLNHTFFNIPIVQFYNYISFDYDYECSICKQSFPSNTLLYFYECNKFYCKKNHLNEHHKPNENQHHHNN